MKYAALIIIILVALTGCTDKDGSATSTLVVTTVQPTSPPPGPGDALPGDEGYPGNSPSYVETTVEVFPSPPPSTLPEMIGPSDEKCNEFKSLERDLCYLGIAINRNDAHVCESILKESRREFCKDNIDVAIDTNSTRIIGQIVNKYSGEGYELLVVEIYGSSSQDIPIAWDRTEGDGYFEFEVSGSDTYDVVVYLNDATLKRTVKHVQVNHRYIVDFIVK